MATRLTRNTVAQPGGLGGERIGGLLPVGGVELLQVARDALLDLGTPPRHLGTREVPVAVVHRLELAAVDRNAGGGQEAHRAAEPDEACANLADGAAIVLAEVRDGLVIGDETPRQPHHLDVASGLPLQPSTGLHPVQVAVDVELEQDRGMIGRPPVASGTTPSNPSSPKSIDIHEGVDHADGVVLVDPVIQALGKQRHLAAIDTFNKTPHPIPPQSSRNLTIGGVFTQPGSTSVMRRNRSDVCSAIIMRRSPAQLSFWLVVGSSSEREA